MSQSLATDWGGVVLGVEEVQESVKTDSWSMIMARQNDRKYRAIRNPSITLFSVSV